MFPFFPLFFFSSGYDDEDSIPVSRKDIIKTVAAALIVAIGISSLAWLITSVYVGRHTPYSETVVEINRYPWSTEPVNLVDSNGNVVGSLQIVEREEANTADAPSSINN